MSSRPRWSLFSFHKLGVGRSHPAASSTPFPLTITIATALHACCFGQMMDILASTNCPKETNACVPFIHRLVCSFCVWEKLSRRRKKSFIPWWILNAKDILPAAVPHSRLQMTVGFVWCFRWTICCCLSDLSCGIF